MDILILEILTLSDHWLLALPITSTDKIKLMIFLLPPTKLGNRAYDAQILTLAIYIPVDLKRNVVRHFRSCLRWHVNLHALDI